MQCSAVQRSLHYNTQHMTSSLFLSVNALRAVLHASDAPSPAASSAARKGDLWLSAAAMVATGPRHPSTAPRTSSLPSLGVGHGGVSAYQTGCVNYQLLRNGAGATSRGPDRAGEAGNGIAQHKALNKPASVTRSIWKHLLPERLILGKQVH